MRQYIALIHKDADSDYGVSFPDFPGLITAGRDLDEARAMAEEALSFHVDGMTEDEEPLQEPSSLDQIMADRINQDGVAILVALKAVPTKAIRVNVTFPADVLALMDEYAEQNGFTRSGFLTRAAKSLITNNETVVHRRRRKAR
jgi:predicted RNase H-like HicB family nuclease